MRLTPDQLELLRSHLQSTFKGGCTVCGGPHWQFDDILFEIRQFTGLGNTPAGLIKPAIAVTCSTCGHIVLINAISAGVIRIEQQAADEIHQQSFTEVGSEVE